MCSTGGSLRRLAGAERSLCAVSGDKSPTQSRGSAPATPLRYASLAELLAASQIIFFPERQERFTMWPAAAA